MDHSAESQMHNCLKNSAADHESLLFELISPNAQLGHKQLNNVGQ